MKKIGVWIVGILISFGIAYLGIQLTSITTIETIGANVRLDIDKNKLPSNLLLFPIDKVKKSLLDEYPQYKDVIIRRKFPSILQVEFIERVPLAVLSFPGRNVTIAEDGTVLQETSDTKLPRILLAKSIELNNKVVHKGVITSLAFLKAMEQYYDIKSIQIEDFDRLNVITSDVIVIISQERDGSESARRLQSLVSGFRIKGSQPRSVDLRFDQPVVTW